MTIRVRYTLTAKARHLTRLARITATTIRPHLELAAHTATLIARRHYVDPPPRTPQPLRVAPTLTTPSLRTTPRQDP